MACFLATRSEWQLSETNSTFSEVTFLLVLTLLFWFCWFHCHFCSLVTKGRNAAQFSDLATSHWITFLLLKEFACDVCTKEQKRYSRCCIVYFADQEIRSICVISKLDPIFFLLQYIVQYCTVHSRIDTALSPFLLCSIGWYSVFQFCRAVCPQSQATIHSTKLSCCL